MKKILVPTDFSKPAEWALEVAIDVAAKAKAHLVLLHVVEQPTEGSFNVEGEIGQDTDWEERIFTTKLIERSRQLLRDRAALVEREGIPLTIEMRLGNPYHGIHHVTTEHDVDLVVMGSTGASRLEDVLLGSTTDRVVRYSKCPVLTIHQKPSTRNFSHIVFATCLNENEKQFADVVKNTQQMYGSTVHLVRINTPMNFQADHEVKELMRAFAAKLRLQNCTLNVFSDRSEEEGIRHFAASINADLIAMATHGRTGVAHALLGSIAEDVVSHASRPVLTYVTRAN